MVTSEHQSNEQEVDLALLVEAIEALTPAQRRHLLRYLRISGLLEVDEPVSDRNRLHIAPALGDRQEALSRSRGPEKGAPNTEQAAQRQSLQMHAAKNYVEAGGDDEAPYHSPVRGKVVVGTPDQEDTASTADPHAMAPVPGQAPEQPIVIVFDGGSRGNPGQGYGSYALRWPGQPQQVVQLRFGDQVTNNEAEYDTLIAALEAVLKRLADAENDPATATVEIWGDSQLVINQVKGAYQAKEPRLRVRRDRVRSLLQQLGAWTLTHHAREQSVRTLGH